MSGPAGKPNLELRVRRLENDRDAIYDLLTDVHTTLQDHTRRLDAIDVRLDGMDRRFDGIDARLAAMDRRFDGIDARLDGIDRRLDAMDLRFDRMDGRFDAVDTTLVEILRRLPEPV